MGKFQVNWDIEDGYIGNSSPQSFYIYADDLWNNTDEDYLEKVFNDLMYEDFQRKVEPVSKDLKRFIEWAKDVIEKQEEEEEDEN